MDLYSLKFLQKIVSRHVHAHININVTYHRMMLHIFSCPYLEYTAYYAHTIEIQFYYKK
jgi:hypothetical protein